jgi:hypothetical protein
MLTGSAANAVRVEAKINATAKAVASRRLGPLGANHIYRSACAFISERSTRDNLALGLRAR